MRVPTDPKVVLKPQGRFNGVKVFSATMFAQREALSDQVTKWIATNPSLEIVDIVVTQSSDSAFHCIALSVFYLETLTTLRPVR